MFSHSVSDHYVHSVSNSKYIFAKGQQYSNWCFHPLSMICGGPEEGRWVRCGYRSVRECESSVRSHDQARLLSALAADAARQLDVLRHDRDALGVDGAQIGVLEEADQIGLRRLLHGNKLCFLGGRERRTTHLQGHDGRRLEAQVGLEVLRNLAHEALERQLADEQLRRLLVATDLTQSDRTCNQRQCD